MSRQVSFLRYYFIPFSGLGNLIYKKGTVVILGISLNLFWTSKTQLTEKVHLGILVFPREYSQVLFYLLGAWGSKCMKKNTLESSFSFCHTL
jgi:hypothetical protein